MHKHSDRVPTKARLTRGAAGSRRQLPDDGVSISGGLAAPVDLAAVLSRRPDAAECPATRARAVAGGAQRAPAVPTQHVALSDGTHIVFASAPVQELETA